MRPRSIDCGAALHAMRGATTFDDSRNCNGKPPIHAERVHRAFDVITCASRVFPAVSVSRVGWRLPCDWTPTNKPPSGSSFARSLLHFQRRIMRIGFAAFLMSCVATATASAGQGQPVTIRTRALRAERVVVASVSDVESAFEVNSHGDRVIVSHMRLQVLETLKGPAATGIPFAI